MALVIKMGGQPLSINKFSTIANGRAIFICSNWLVTTRSVVDGPLVENHIGSEQTSELQVAVLGVGACNGGSNTPSASRSRIDSVPAAQEPQCEC